MDKPRDLLGSVIEVGDMVTYPVRKGADMWMAVGTVVAIDTTEDDGDYAHDITVLKESSGRKAHVWNTHTMVKILPTKDEKGCCSECQCEEKEGSAEETALKPSPEPRPKFYGYSGPFDISDETVREYTPVSDNTNKGVRIDKPMTLWTKRKEYQTIHRIEAQGGHNYRITLNEEDTVVGVLAFQSFSGFTF